MAWQTDHRNNSPYPLRHFGTNLHVVARQDNEATFSSYIFVTQIASGISPVSTAIVNGTARLADHGLRIAALEVVLDTMDSKPFGER